MTTNNAALIEQLVTLVDNWATEHNRRDVTAYKIVTDLRDEAAGRGMKQCGQGYSELMSDAFCLIYDANDGPWFGVWDRLLADMDDLAENAND